MSGSFFSSMSQVATISSGTALKAFANSRAFCVICCVSLIPRSPKSAFGSCAHCPEPASKKSFRIWSRFFRNSSPTTARSFFRPSRPPIRISAFRAARRSAYFSFVFSCMSAKPAATFFAFIVSSVMAAIADFTSSSVMTPSLSSWMTRAMTSAR